MGNRKSHEEPSKDTHDAEQSPESSKSEGLEMFYKPTLEKMKKHSACCLVCTKILFVVLGVLVILLSLATLVVSISTAYTTKVYSSELSGRLVAMVILAVTAAIALCVSIYSMVGVARGSSKSLHASSLLLLFMAVIQAIILGVSVQVTPEDEMALGRSLSDSFRLAREDNPRHMKIWATTQSDLNCCGVYSPEDYRSPRIPNYFPPDVPISCCPTFSPERSELVQEREREICKARKEFYDIGCRTLVVEVFRETASMVLGVVIVLIILEVIQAIVACGLSSGKSREKKAASVCSHHHHHHEDGFSHQS